MKRHGGRVRAEGKVGEGATFYFTFPLPPAGDPDSGARSLTGARMSGDDDPASERVVLERGARVFFRKGALSSEELSLAVRDAARAIEAER